MGNYNVFTSNILLETLDDDIPITVTLRILTGKKHSKMKLQAYEKYEYGHLGRWYIKLTLFKRFKN